MTLSTTRVKASKDAPHDSNGVILPHELQHGAPRRKEMCVRRASSLGGCALKQHVVFIPQGMLITKKAEPLCPRNSVYPDGKLVAPQPKANHPINLRKAKGQAEEGIEWSIVRQDKPTVELAKSSPLGDTCARADSTTLPALPRAGGNMHFQARLLAGSPGPRSTVVYTCCLHMKADNRSRPDQCPCC